MNATTTGKKLATQWLVECFVGSPRFVAAEFKLRHGYLVPVSYRMLAGSAAYVVGFRPRRAHPQATGRTRWELNAGYTTIGIRTPAKTHLVPGSWSLVHTSGCETGIKMPSRATGCLEVCTPGSEPDDVCRRAN